MAQPLHLHFITKAVTSFVDMALLCCNQLNCNEKLDLSSVKEETKSQSYKRNLVLKKSLLDSVLRHFWSS